ncbi:glycosyltransferase family 4 protein [Lachnospiraceae bacterium 54-11]
MKVIVANYRFFVDGGPARYLFNFMAAAQKRGIEVIPFSVRNPQNEKTDYARYFARPRADMLMYSDTRRSLKNIYGMLRAVTWNFDAAKRLKKLIRDTRPDAVYILHEINHLSPSIIRAARKEGVRVVHRISDFFMFCARYDFLQGDEICEECLGGQYSKAIGRRCVKDSRAATCLRVAAMKLYQWNRVFQDVDMFVVPSAFTGQKLAEGGISEKKITHIATFIDSEAIVPGFFHEKYFLFIGRMVRQKGVIYAVRAMNELKNSGYILKITGTLSEAGEDEELKRYILEHGLESKVIFTGFLKGRALEELISRAACVICPSIWYENMPNTILEAYAYGKPVVASRLGSLEEIVEDGYTGFLFPPKDSFALAEQLEKFIQDEDLSARLGKQARERCEERYGEDKHMEKLISCLRGEKLGKDGEEYE